MQDETLNQPPAETLTEPLVLPRPRGNWRAVLVTALLCFALGGAVVGWLVRSGHLPYALPEPGKAAAVRLARMPAARVPVAGGEAATEVALGGVETRLALLEDRLSRIDGEATHASANAARAEALLIAFAARRRLEQGQSLGYIEEQLKLRFAGAQPQAVATLIAAAKTPVTLDELDGELSAASAALTGTTRDESTWTRARRELASLFVVRRAPIPAAPPAQRITRARLMLASGRTDEAVAEIERLPGADGAHAWIAAARRYGETQRALDLIETAAMLEPRRLQDAAGNAVAQPGPLVPPADFAPAHTAN